MRRLLYGLVALVALVAVFGAGRARVLPAPLIAPAPPVLPSSRDVRVAYHVHSTRSDGTGTPESIAEAAWAAGLDAVILTDHGDGTRPPEPPRRLHGVLVIDGVEISTWGGHYVALGARPSPYPLAGDPASVVEDVARLGGFGIAAHPGSAKDGLKWRAWDAPFEGLEWLNADSEWRDRPRDLWEAVATYPWAPVATITALLDRPRFELREWDRRAAQQPVVGLAAHDAHARVGLRGVGEPYDGGVALQVPDYAVMFKTFSNVVRIAGTAWGGDAEGDAARVLTAMRAGRVYAVVSGRGGAWLASFQATSGAASATMGGHLVPEGPVRVQARTLVPEGAVSSLVCDGRVVATAPGGVIDWTSPEPPGACRVEVRLDAAADAMPWLVTNPIYARVTLSTAPPRALAEPTVVLPIPRSGEPAAWTPEVAPGAGAVVSADPAQPRRVVYRWQLGAGDTQYAALRFDTPADLHQHDRLVLRASADRPMRIWLQWRTPADGGRRWGRSVYLDQTPRQVTLPFDSFLAMDAASTQRLPVRDVTALLLVVDTTHARPGEHGTVTFDELWMAR